MRAVLPVVGSAAVMLLLVLACRGATMTSPAALNPDEAELLAVGRRAALSLLPYQAYTTSTFQVLWPASLGFLAVLGVPMILQTAHVLSGLAYAWIGLTAWLMMSRRLGWLVAGTFVLPAVGVVLVGPGPQPVDFLSLGTELLPVSLIMLAALVLLVGAEAPGRRRMTVACAIAGLAPLAKPQAVVLALAFCGVAVLLRRLRPATSASSLRAESIGLVREAIVAGAAFLLPSVVLLLEVMATGMLRTFIDEPVAYIYGYIKLQGVELIPGHPLTLADRLNGMLEGVSWYPMALLPAAGGLLAAGAAWRRLTARARLVGLIVIAGPVASGLLTLSVLNPVFPHYLNLVLGSSVLAGMAGTATARYGAMVPPIGHGDPDREAPTIPARTARAVSTAGVGRLAGGIALSLGAVAWALSGMGLTIPAMWSNSMTAVGAAIWSEPAALQGSAAPGSTADSCRAGQRVFVWGWAAELYAEHDWTPASRYVAWWPLSFYGRPRVYRATLEAELRADPPQCVIEAIGPAFYGYYDPATDTIAARIPTLAAWLASCYDRSMETLPGDRPITLWRRTGECASG